MVPKSDIGKYDYHTLKVAVVKDSLFQEEDSEHLGDQTKNPKARTPSQPAPSGTVLKGTELPFGRVTGTSHFPRCLEGGQRRVCWLRRWKEKGKGRLQKLPKTCWV